MAHSASDAHIDGGLDYLAANCDKIVLCIGAPSSYADANTTRNCAQATGITGANFTKANGDTSGRKTSLNAALADLPVTATGNADHAAFLKTGTSELIRVNPLASTIAVENGGTVTLQAGKIAEIADPTT